MKILENKFINTTKAEEEQIARVLELKQFSGMSPIVKEYEEKLAKYFKTKFAHAVSSGTDAIELALRALNIGEGDEVITTPLGPVMTPLPILAVGAKPVFVDVESENNFGISLQDLMAKVSKHTKAVITVPMWGYPTETSDLIDFCRLKGIALIEDASHCHGAKIDNDYVGTQGDIGIFSTQERKLIGTGEGGIMLTNDEYLSARIQEVRNFGKPIRKELIQQGLEDQYGHLFGLNYRLSAFSAAIGIAQIDKLEEKIGLRTENAEFIKKGIDKRYFQEIPILINSRPNHYSIVLNFDHPTLNAEELGKQLSFNGIISDTYRFKYKPLYELPIFERYESICINASALSRKIITLPTHEGLTKEELNYIVETVNKLVS